MPRMSKVSSSGENASPFTTMVSSEALSVISGTPPSLSKDSIRKIVAQISLPSEYEWVLPLPSLSTNNPLPGMPPSQLLPNSYSLMWVFSYVPNYIISSLRWKIF
ncbi:hypothetical protein Salat_2736800 [Sesamum alatum]|uniref:Uncharacterized protein n=1 Tax=Sesamum alatum TaxID=300844 RepID=A0AAE1XJW2_9LAMI|nr:hypothetical protein Salat_2736800 [Sesamum alatum]